MNFLSNVVIWLAVILPAFLYFKQAWKQKKEIRSIMDFFPLTHSISSGEYRSTTVAAGMSLATVVLTLVNLSPFMGLTLFVSVFTYGLSYLILYPCVGRIMTANPQNDTIQSYLGKAYSSNSVRITALIFSLIGYISIFSMELLVGVSVLEPFLGNKVMVFSFLYLIFLIIYSLLGGYKAIIATDRWQLRFIIGSIIALYIFGIFQFSNAKDVNISAVFLSISKSWVPVWPFILGITVMNLLSIICDAGTWQRLCSTKSPNHARKGLLQITPFFIILWSALVFFGCFYSQISEQFGFDPSKENLMSHIVSSMASNGIFSLLLLFTFTLGLFSAMISTADSLLIVAGQIISIDFLNLKRNKTSKESHLRNARIAMAIIAFLSFSIFAIFKLIKFDVVQLVFAIYGAQLAMFPSVFISLFFMRSIDLSKMKYAAATSILFGFIGGWGSALYGKFSGSMNWLYNAPISALISALVVFVILSLPMMKRIGGRNG